MVNILVKPQSQAANGKRSNEQNLESSQRPMTKGDANHIGSPSVPETMRAMVIKRLGLLAELRAPLVAEHIPVPQPRPSEVLIRVSACGVCHTEIDEIEGRTPPAILPMTPGHQVVGKVVLQGTACKLDLAGKTIGVAWIHSACGVCNWCRQGRENLCPDFVACGRDIPGGYAEFMVAPERFVHEIPSGMYEIQAAPLLCAGAVGYRALRLCKLKNG
jgi:propanol-preferring alcohol dehydrogenase